MNPMHLQLAASARCISDAELALGVTFPKELSNIWGISNGLELPGGWRFFPVFDEANARKTGNHIVYENTTGRWEILAPQWLSIAAGDTGNALVLRKAEGRVDVEVMVWDHETRNTRKWAHDLGYIAELARKRVEKIRKQMKGL